MKRRILYVTGSRADFGLMLATLQLAAANPRLDVATCVTGMHLSELFGRTEREVESSGLSIAGRVHVETDRGDGATMARGIAQGILGMVEVFADWRPDIVLLLGDRGEMLAGAITALHLNIHIAHIHGGERSGSVDEPIRHAISKMSHHHFVATPEARDRLIRMGENAADVYVTGAPGLDGLTDLASLDRCTLCDSVALDPNRAIALVVFHPVVQEAAHAEEQVRQLIQAIESAGLQAVCLLPNSDAGSVGVRASIMAWSKAPRVRVFDHLPRHEFVSWMRAADVMVGNSSSGIIEAATFCLPVVNVGARQAGRTRSANVIDCGTSAAEIRHGLDRALARGRLEVTNAYGDGHSGERIVALLASLELDPARLMKTNAY